MMRGSMTLVVTAILLHGIGAQASSLDKEVCAKLKDEQAQLEQVGLRATMAKGPGWAKSNLPPDKMEQVRRLIEVDEQLTFRCQGKPLVLLPSSVDADPVTTVEGAPDGEKDAEGNPIPGKVGPAKAGPAKEEKAAPVKKAAVVKSDKPGDAKSDKPAGEAKAEPAKKAPAKAPEAKQGEAKPGEPKAADAAKKVAPKKKVDDAYKPPPSDAYNPFNLPESAKK